MGNGRSRKRILAIHYAWVVLGVTFIGLLSTAGVRSVSGIIIQPLELEFGWSRESITLAISINLLLFGFAGPFLGRLIDCFGPRIVAVSMMILMIIGLGGTLWMSQPWHFCLLWGLIVGTGSAGTSMVMGATVVNRWFHEHRGLALGVLGAAMSAGQLIFTQVIMHLSATFGWRFAMLSVAILIGLIALPLAVLFMVDDPGKKALQPYGSIGTVVPPLRSGANPMAIALRRVEFWLLAFSFGICGLTTSGLVQTHLIPHGIEHGFSEMTMAVSLGVMGAADILGTIVSGWICDRFGKRGPLAIYYLLRGASLLALPYINDTDELMVFSILYGLNWLSTVPATSALTADLFGKQNVGAVFGWIFFAHQFGAAIAAYSASFLHSWHGGYTLTFTMAGAFAILGTGLVLCIRHESYAPLKVG